MATPFDVVIAGGGLAGLTLALQLRQEAPDISVCVVERTTRPLPLGAHKVGESSVELGSQYLERLGLAEELEREHIIKFGLRFFPGGGTLPLADRTEIASDQEPIVRSYQLDRGAFESSLRERVVASGGILFEGHRVTDVTLDADTRHTVEIAPTGGGDAQTLTSRWFVDATGRAAFLRKRLKLTRRNRHPAHAGWFRVEGRLDVTDLVPESERDWHGRPMASDRWRSTNHFMGDGYWAWLIPLSSGLTSVGLVVHGDRHEFGSVRTSEAVLEFLRNHEPLLATAVEARTRLDFGCLKGYSHTIGRAWSTDRWALIGEAGAFVDPLYSPGTDYIAFANSFTAELMRAEREDDHFEERTTMLNLQYRALVAGNCDVYRNASSVYGHDRAMTAKIYWDNYAYWCYPCQYYLRGIYKLRGEEHRRFTPAGQRFAELSHYVQRLLAAWADLAPKSPDGGFYAVPAFPSVVVDAHLALQRDMTPDETLDYVNDRARVGEAIVAELLIRVAHEVGPELADEIFERAEVCDWALRVPASRIEQDHLEGRARHQALGRVTRDLDRRLGQVERTMTPTALRAALRPLVDESTPASCHP